MKLKGDIDFSWLLVLLPMIVHYAFIILKVLVSDIVPRNKPIDIAAHNSNALAMIAEDGKDFVTVDK